MSDADLKMYDRCVIKALTVDNARLRALNAVLLEALELAIKDGDLPYHVYKKARAAIRLEGIER